VELHGRSLTKTSLVFDWMRVQPRAGDYAAGRRGGEENPAASLEIGLRFS
jgi:hypothetical protein